MKMSPRSQQQQRRRRWRRRGEAEAEAEAEEAEETTRPIEHLQRLRLRCVYGIRVLTMTTAAASE